MLPPLALLLLAGSVTAAAAAAEKALPSNWPRCRVSAPLAERDECMRDAINAVIPEIAPKGAKELGVYPIDPLKISKMDLGQGSGPVSIDLTLSNLDIIGIGAARVQKFTGTLNATEFYLFAPITPLPTLRLQGNYKVNGNVLILPIRGQGLCDIAFTDSNVTVELFGKKLSREGKNYLHITVFKFTIEPKTMKMQFDDLFEGNKQLSDQMNKFLNENWKVILAEIMPAIQEAFGAAFADVSNRIFHKVPFDKIFLP